MMSDIEPLRSLSQSHTPAAYTPADGGLRRRRRMIETRSERFCFDRAPNRIYDVRRGEFTLSVPRWIPA